MKNLNFSIDWKTFAVAAAILSATSCGKNPDLCDPVPIEEREDCTFGEEKNTNINSVSGFRPLCESNCRRTGDLAVLGVEGLSSLKPLSEFKYMKGLVVAASSPLSSLEGLDHLETIGRLDIGHNPNLTTLEGADSLRKIEGALDISSTRSLKNLDGLETLQKADRILIRSNEGLESISGLRNVTMTDSGRLHRIDIAINSELKAIDGLQSLETLDGVLTITQNAELTSLEGLKNLTKVTEELEISRNPKLPQCEIDELLSHVDAGEVNVKLNGSEAEPCDKNGT